MFESPFAEACDDEAWTIVAALGLAMLKAGRARDSMALDEDFEAIMTSFEAPKTNEICIHTSTYPYTLHTDTPYLTLQGDRDQSSIPLTYMAFFCTAASSQGGTGLPLIPI